MLYSYGSPYWKWKCPNWIPCRPTFKYKNIVTNHADWSEHSQRYLRTCFSHVSLIFSILQFSTPPPPTTHTQKGMEAYSNYSLKRSEWDSIKLLPVSWNPISGTIPGYLSYTQGTNKFSEHSEFRMQPKTQGKMHRNPSDGKLIPIYRFCNAIAEDFHVTCDNLKCSIRN